MNVANEMLKAESFNVQDAVVQVVKIKAAHENLLKASKVAKGSCMYC